MEILNTKSWAWRGQYDSFQSFSTVDACYDREVAVFV